MSLFQASAKTIATRIWQLFIAANDNVVSNLKSKNPEPRDGINLKRLEFSTRIYNISVLIFILKLNGAINVDKKIKIIDLLYQAFLRMQKKDQTLYRIGDFIVNEEELASLKNTHKLMPESTIDLESLTNFVCVPRMIVYHNILNANLNQFQNPAALAKMKFWKRTAEVFSILYKPTTSYILFRILESNLYISAAMLMKSHIAVDRDIVSSDLSISNLNLDSEISQYDQNEEDDYNKRLHLPVDDQNKIERLWEYFKIITTEESPYIAKIIEIFDLPKTDIEMKRAEFNIKIFTRTLYNYMCVLWKIKDSISEGLTVKFIESTKSDSKQYLLSDIVRCKDEFEHMSNYCKATICTMKDLYDGLANRRLDVFSKLQIEVHKNSTNVNINNLVLAFIKFYIGDENLIRGKFNSEVTCILCSVELISLLTAVAVAFEKEFNIP